MKRVHPTPGHTALRMHMLLLTWGVGIASSPEDEFPKMGARADVLEERPGSSRSEAHVTTGHSVDAGPGRPAQPARNTALKKKKGGQPACLPGKLGPCPAA